MEFIENIVVNPVAASFFGWLAFNWWLFSDKKDEADDLDQKFHIGIYISKVWDNWIGSFLAIPILLYIGYNKIDIQLDTENVGWSSLYYLFAGIVPEFAMDKFKKWRKSKKA